MSKENVEVVKAAFEAWNAGDMDAFRNRYHPDVTMRPMENWPEPGPWVGRDEVMRQFRQLRETYDADTWESTTAFRHIADRVVVRGIWHGVGQGPESHMEFTIVCAVRHGTI